MKLSLRGQLALWYVLAIPALILALTFTAQHIIVTNLRGALDDTLRERAELVAANIASRLATSPESYAAVVERITEQELPVIPLLLRITDSNGTSLVTFGDVPDTIVPALDRQLKTTGAAEGRFGSVKVKGGEALRTYTVAVQDPSTQQAWVLIQTGDSLAHVTAVQNRLQLFALGEGIVGSIVVLGIGMLILRRGFRPLDRILGKVQEIETGSLQPGLPDEPRPPELQRLANSLNAMWERLDMAFKGRETFFASVSHDLRTPLTALQGQIDTLLLEDFMNPGSGESLQRMAKEVRRLIRLTNNPLLNTQLDFDVSLAPEDVSLRALMEDVVAEMWVLSDGLELGLRIDEDIRIPADRDLLKQMVLNLVDNAIKFTPRGGRIELSVKKEANEAVVEVADSGIGISSEALSRLSEAFSMAPGPSQQPRGGAGLGLVIVKRVADLHGGRIEINSQEGIGTTIKVAVPLPPGDLIKTSGTPKTVGEPQRQTT